MSTDKTSLENESLGAVSFNIFDTVYMDSPFGRYTGIVKDVKDGKMTIESHSPTGKGMMLADYDVEGTEWKNIEANELAVCPDCAEGRDSFEPNWKCPECRRQTDR